jgi:hypothetical protein
VKDGKGDCISTLFDVSGFHLGAVYSYIKINGLYLQRRQSILCLAWFLFFRSNSLKQRSTFKTRKLLNTFKTFVLFRMGLKKLNHIKNFPVNGNLIFKVNGGYRVFNFHRKSVTKIIHRDLSPAEVSAEIEGVQKASNFDFAPKLFECNTAEHWYEEELIDGVIGYSELIARPDSILKVFDRDIVRCLAEMFLIHTPIPTTVGDIVARCNRTWTHDRLNQECPERQKLDSFFQFVQPIVARLVAREGQAVCLVFSHGDFSLRNMLMTQSGLKILDWETTANRSILFDLYNFFLTELYYQRVSTNLIGEVDEAIRNLQARVIAHNSVIANHFVEFAELYRLLYYVERIAMLLERHPDDKIFNVIFRSIEVFENFEQSVPAGSDVN